MENVVFWFEIIVAMLTGLVACIPLVIKLVQVIKDAVRAKNWAPLMQLVLKLMAEAEQAYTNGADKTMAALLSKDAEIGLMGSEASIYVYNGGQKDYAINFAQLTQ